MNFEIKGTNLINKGAELMLLAVIQEVKKNYSDALLVVAPKFEDYPGRANLELWQKVWLDKYSIQWGNFAKVIPGRLRKRYGLILDNEINVVLDASGFLFSDQFGEHHTVKMASYVKTWKRRGTSVILLPQAMGPFTTDGIRRAFAIIANNADLVFPRDDISYKHVTDLVGERPNIIQSPDFTNLIAGVPPNKPDKFMESVCIVPNSRMVDKTPEQDAGAYCSFCTRCIKCLSEMGRNSFILVHEGDDDMRLATRIMEKSCVDITIVKESDALRVKGILGNCYGVISSRFHALVSSLSQGTPALATSWSHKYEMLLAEYGIAEGCLPLTIDDATLKGRIASIVEKGSRGDIISTLERRSEEYKGLSVQMWKRVFEAIEVNPK